MGLILGGGCMAGGSLGLFKFWDLGRGVPTTTMGETSGRTVVPKDSRLEIKSTQPKPK